MVPLLPIISSAPVLPPIGLIFLIAWRVLRPGLWPVWAGVPFGLIDDILSGQPIGSAVLIWSTILIAMDIIEQRYIWRNYWQDWFISAIFIIFALSTGLLVNNFLGSNVHLYILMPQMIISIAIYPLILRLVGRLDHLRLKR